MINLENLLATLKFFWVSLSSSFDLEEMAVMEVFEVAEFESVLKIEMAPFLVGLGPIFARYLGITRDGESCEPGNVSNVFLVEFLLRNQ